MINNTNIVEKSTGNLVVLDLKSKLLQSNIVMIDDEITPESTSDYVASILYLMQSLESVEDKVINIYISSPGGCANSCLKLIDLFELAKSKGYIIRTLGMGLVASAATILLMAGSKGYRDCTKLTRIMFHELAHGTIGKLTDTIIDMEEAKTVQSIINDLVKEYSCEELSNTTRDKWMSVEQAKELNVIDNII